MLKHILSLAFIFHGLTSIYAQSDQRIESFNKIKQDNTFSGLSFRNIGPSVMSGRISDFEVNPTNSYNFYVAYASGGLWVTYNNGQTFEPIFDHQASITIGDIAVDWQNHILYVGTGEVNSSRSSYAGTGIYKSADTGKTWTHLGLAESHHIGRILLDPKQPTEIQVAVLGHLYTKNKERGLYKSTDGGKTWKQTLYVNDSTGIVELIRKNKDELFCASWSRARKAWHFNGSGTGSAIYYSNDNGNTWRKITTAANGFPQNEGVGRIGLATNKKSLYAILDNQNREEIKNDKNELTALSLQKMDKEAFLQLKNEKIDAYLKANGYDKKYKADAVKKAVQENKYTVKDIADWVLDDADASLFQTSVIGAELYISKDNGNTWQKQNKEKLEGLVFTYGYYFGTIACAEQNDSLIFVAGYPILKSTDGGQTFAQTDGENCHPDYHKIWINPANDQHIIAANDGGLNISYDQGKNWIKCNNPAVGQFYAIEVDDEKPYNVYGGLQDNGTWFGPSNARESVAWHQSGQYHFKEIGGGDGMQVRVDTRNNKTVYSGYQFGYYNRSATDGSEKYLPLHPSNDIGQPSYRFNWQTPIWLSKHNQDIFYMGSNCFHRSLNKGENLEKLSQDLSKHAQKGNVPYGTITSIHESPLRFGLIYCGTDDGNLHISKDLGYNWESITKGLPADLWVSRVCASKHKLERVYCTLNGYRNDDFSAYIFVSEDYGKTWRNIGESLPAEPVNVIKEDPKKDNIIYVGTDNGLYVSYNNGQNFKPLQANLPRVAIHDIAIQERENEIVLGTHGRSIYIGALRNIQLYDSIKDFTFYADTIAKLNFDQNWGKYLSVLEKQSYPTININYYSLSSQNISIQIKNSKGKIIKTEMMQAKPGFNTHSFVAENSFATKEFVAMNQHFYLDKGKYKLVFMSNEQVLQEEKLSVE